MNDNQNDNLVLYTFERKFGPIGKDNHFKTNVYSCFNTKKVYKIPRVVSKSDMIELAKRSLKDNHDYIFNLVGKKENELVINDDILI